MTTLLAGVSRAEREAWAVLAAVDGVGPVALMRLVRRHGSASEVLAIAGRPGGAADLVRASRGPLDDDLADGAPRREWLAQELASALAVAAAEAPALRARLRALDVDVLLLEDREYPRRLLGLEEPPPVLFARGDLACLDPPHPVAVVGTRRPTEAGLRLAVAIGEGVTRAGGTVVSGLALGIDGAAHRAAVKAGGPTIAVLGSGHGRLYPADHRSLADEIVATGGCILSELAPDVPGNRGTFPRRNWVISGLADAVVVVEAPRKSGALITADWALAQGRECFLVPGPIGAHATEGNLRYLRGYAGQARVVESVPSLLEDLGFDVRVRPGVAPTALGLGETEARLAGLVTGGMTTVDALAGATGLPVSTVLSALTLLEIRGLIVGAYGRYRPTGELVPRIDAKQRRARSPHAADVTPSRAPADRRAT